MDATPTIGSSLSLPDTETYCGFKLWVVVPANSQSGVLIDGLHPKDQVFVNQAINLNGMAAFTDTSMPGVDGIVGMANALLADGTQLMYPDNAAAQPFADAWASSFATIKQAAHENPQKHKLRNVFGKDPGDGKYQIDEGGVILCMPEAEGPIYSNDDTRPADDSRDNGRLPKYWPALVKELNSGFLYPDKPAQLIGTAQKAGGLVVIAFDQSNAFGDNNGAYAMEVDVVRAVNAPSDVTEQQIFQRLSDAPPTSGIGDLGLNG